MKGAIGREASGEWGSRRSEWMKKKWQKKWKKKKKGKKGSMKLGRDRQPSTTFPKTSGRVRIVPSIYGERR